MAVDFHLGKNFPNRPVAPDYETSSLDTHELAAVKRLFFVNPVSFTHHVAGVAQQREVQRVLVDELLMCGRGIGADPDHFRTQLAHPADIVSKAARLRSTPRCHVLWIKIEHDVTASGQ